MSLGHVGRNSNVKDLKDLEISYVKKDDKNFPHRHNLPHRFAHNGDKVLHTGDNLARFNGLGVVRLKYHMVASKRYVPQDSCICSKHEFKLPILTFDAPERPTGPGSPEEPLEGWGWGEDPPTPYLLIIH